MFAAEPPTIELVVIGESELPESTRTEIERELAVTLVTDEKCPVNIAERDRPAPYRLEVRVSLWRESEEPGGVATFDPRIGGYRPGTMRRVETAYRATLLGSGGKPLAEDDWRRNHTLGSRDVMGWDPRVETRRAALREVGRDLSRFLCKQLKKQAR